MMSIPIDYAIWYFLVINLISLVLFGIDKGKAKSGRRRISEMTLLLVSLAGGVFGGILGMAIFRHKTRKLRFKLLMFFIFLLNCYFLYNFIKRI